MNKIDLDYLINFNRELRNYQYGIIYQGRKILDPTEEDFWQRYTTLAPSLFKIYKCGTCWDYVIYQDSVLRSKYTLHYSIYSESAKGESHAFTVCVIDGKYYYFEAAYKQYAGIYEFDSLDSAVSYVNNLLANEWISARITTYKYEPNEKVLINASCEKFMDYFHYKKPYVVTNDKVEPISIIK